MPREAAARDAPARSKEAALSIIEQRAEIPIAGKQHDVIDLVCDLQGVDSKFDAHAALELAASLAIVELFCWFRLSGHSGKSPKLRSYLKREAEKNYRVNRKRIRDPKPSVQELFHPKGRADG